MPSDSDVMPSLQVGQTVDVIVKARKKYNPSKVSLDKNAEYIFIIPPNQKWTDDRIECDEKGWLVKDHIKWWLKPGIIGAQLFRRVRKSNWFELCATIGKSDTHAFSVLNHLHNDTPYIPTISGECYFFANDLSCKYDNNKGSVSVSIKRIK